MQGESAIFRLSERRNARAFWIGSVVVSIGVALHLPMFWMARSHGFILSGMPMGQGMLVIFLGIGAGDGLLAPALWICAAILALATGTAVLLMGVCGCERRGRDLRALETR